jgi:hypothetical protein
VCKWDLSGAYKRWQYAHGMTMRDILCHLNQVCGTEPSPEQVRAIIDGAPEEVRAWQHQVAVAAARRTSARAAGAVRPGTGRWNIRATASAVKVSWTAPMTAARTGAVARCLFS